MISYLFSMSCFNITIKRMESIFCRFESYNFESDARFQEGLRSVQKAEEEQLDMKLFYYNRFVEPIDRSAYKQWRSSNGTSDPASTDSLPTEGSPDTEDAVLTFAEVLKLVQEGKEVPGVKNVDIQPTNQNPAPSQMQRILKPWEKPHST